MSLTVMGKITKTVSILNIFLFGCDDGFDSVANDDDMKLVCYYGSWAVYRPGNGKFPVEEIDPFLCR